jgi:uncharacterized protein YfaP (DUF2135 family)
LSATAPSAANAINGGSVTISLTSGGTIVKVYVQVMGSDGYYEITVPAGSSVADVLLTLAQTLPSTVTFIFEVVDSSGNVSAPTSTMTAITTVGTGDVQVSVSWDADNDLDLHVVDPNGFEVYYGADTSPEGGTLDLDSNAGCTIDGVNNENITWPTGAAPHGMYTVRVDNYEQCPGGLGDNYVVTVRLHGHPAMVFNGSFPASDLGDSGSAGSGTTITTFTW